jgi:antibiotic biosynthesis monooxygenase (ABM) superfamily enzyme
MNEPIQVAIVRTVRPGCETAFEQALHDFVQRTLPQTGQMGVHIIRPAPGSPSLQYGIIRKFTDREALAAFRTSPEYLAWNQTVLDLTEGRGCVEELCGLESWFTLPGQPLRPLPQWKMAIATYLGVVPVIMGLSVTLGPLISSWNFVLNNLVFNAFVVALLTWVVMPLITHALHGWLNANEPEASRARRPAEPDTHSDIKKTNQL